MTNNPAQISVKLARECMALAQESRLAFVLANPRSHPTDSVAVQFSCVRILAFYKLGNSILWDVLMNLPPDRFRIPNSFPCELRYVTKLDTPVKGSVLSLHDGTLSDYSDYYPKTYFNFDVRAVLRAGYALSHMSAFADVLIVGGAGSATAPAAYDPDQFLCSSDELDMLFSFGMDSFEFMEHYR